MNTKTITISVMLLGIIAWIGWDIYVATNSIRGDTISEITLGVSYSWSIIPFMGGVLVGHLWWPSTVRFHKTTRLIILLSTCLGVFIVDRIFVKEFIPAVPLFFGIFAGHYFWPQVKKETKYI